MSQKDAALPGRRWPPGPNRVAPVDPVEHVGQLRRADRDDAAGRRRPHKATVLQPLGIKRHANAIVPKNFYQMTAFAAKNVKVAGMRIALQLLLYLQRQSFMPLRMSVRPTASHTRLGQLGRILRLRVAEKVVVGVLGSKVRC